MSTITERIKVNEALELTMLSQIHLMLNHLSPLAFLWCKLFGVLSCSWWWMLAMMLWLLFWDTNIYYGRKKEKEWLTDGDETDPYYRG